MTFERYKKKYPKTIPPEFTENDYNAMIEANPYRDSWLFGGLNHFEFNNSYKYGWQRGYYASLNSFLTVLYSKGLEKEWSITKEDLRQVFAKMFNNPDFGREKV